VNRSTRLVELDFFRGVALLIIFWDHLHWFADVGFPLHYGFSDAAAVFVFLSGYVSGLVYWKTYMLKGFREVFYKALTRVLQIYGVHIFAVTVLLGIAAITSSATQHNPMHIFLKTFTDNPSQISIKIILLQYFPELFDILPLYIVLMLFVPGILYLIKRNWRFSFFLLFALYCATQLIPQLNLRLYYPSWTFNPLSWLFLFGSAMIISIKVRDGSLRIPVKPLYAAAAVIALVYSLLDLKTINQFLINTGILPGELIFIFPSPFPLIEKSTLEPVSLVHFICLAYIVSIKLEYLRPLIGSRFFYPLVVSGRHSLALFSSGIVLTYLFAYLIILLGANPVLFYSFAVTGWIVTIVLGFSLSQKDVRSKAVRYQLSSGSGLEERKIRGEKINKLKAS
jgi:hypothetical protein